jgi:hypothetical protein
MQLDAPIIIIGAGRSGSTLLDRMLGAHPDIHMLGETNFITATLWKSLLDRRKRHLLTVADSETILAELKRLGGIEQKTIAELFELNSAGKSHWGMKEIWNGARRTVEWSLYDRVYPAAIWVHLIRNPIDYSRSAVGWIGAVSDTESYLMQLRAWRRMVEVARGRAVTGRLVEVRYEELVANPSVALAPLFSRIGVPYSPACEDPLKESWVESKSLPSLPQMPIEDLLTIAGLLDVLDDLGYEFVAGEGRVGLGKARDFGSSEDGKATAFPQGTEDAGALLVMEPDDISPEQGHAFCYWAPLLVGISDTPDQPQQSSFLLLEDGKIIGTPHALHSDVREKGRGLWSHWGQNIFFSSSDGTDPRQNGREYALMKPRHESQVRGTDE